MTRKCGSHEYQCSDCCTLFKGINSFLPVLFVFLSFFGVDVLVMPLCELCESLALLEGLNDILLILSGFLSTLVETLSRIYTWNALSICDFCKNQCNERHNLHRA